MQETLVLILVMVGVFCVILAFFYHFKYLFEVGVKKAFQNLITFDYLLNKNCNKSIFLFGVSVFCFIGAEIFRD